MITIKEWMELVDYKITEGSDYGWGCYGPNSFQLDSWNGVHGKGGYSFSIVFSTKSQKIYEVSMCDYTNDRAYRMINPKFQEKHRKEAESRNVNLNEAWDDVDYVELDVLDDFIQKALAIRAGESYDTRVQVQVDFSDEDLLQYMKLAHERDMTFNEFVEEALRDAIEAVEDGRLTKEDARRFVLESETAWPFKKEEDDEDQTGL
jgi:DNA-binding PucR family transcriptional regulator